MIRVLVIDDSALVRKLLTKILGEDPEIEVVGTAADPYVARERIKKLNPDVLTLDVEMPRMDGVTFLGNLMRLRPMPVVMVSSLTEKGADITLRALELGAVDFVSKPKVDVSHGLQEYAEELRSKVKVAAGARLRPAKRRPPRTIDVVPKLDADAVIRARRGQAHFRTTEKIVAVGASTGGTEAIKEVLMNLPPDSPGVVVAQHIPAGFSGAFAERMNGSTPLTVYQAQDNQPILAGHVYIAPGDQHLMVVRDGARYRCRLHDGPAVNRHKPSVDVLFRSITLNVGPNAIGVLLTGMGEDGAGGMCEMRNAGISTIAQDERTSVVWGMPGAAVALGGAGCVLPLEEIAAAITAIARPGGDPPSVRSATQ